METIPLFGPYALRRLRTEDAPDIFASIDTQRRYLGRWLPFVADTHRIEQTRQVVAGMLADTANPVFTLRSGNAFAGLIGFKSADAARRSVEIGYWLREEQQGKGIMAAAVRTLCDLAFGEMGMRRVEIRCGHGQPPEQPHSAASRLPPQPCRGTRRTALRRRVDRPERLRAGTLKTRWHPPRRHPQIRSGPMPYAATGPMTPCAVHPASHRKKETCGEASFSILFIRGGRRPYFFLIELISCAGVA